MDRGRLLKLLGARAYRDRPHLVLRLETQRMMRRHAPRVSLSRVNSGATFFMSPAPRGTNTFRRIADHPERDPIVEFAVDHAQPGVADFVLSVSR